MEDNEDNEEMENDNLKDIIVVNEDGFNNCLVGFNYDEKPREVFPPIIVNYKYQYYATKDSDPKNDDKFKEKLEKCLSKFQLREHLKKLNINLSKEDNNINEDEIKIQEVKENYPFDENGIIQNWDNIEFLWGEIFSKKLKVSPEEYNIILTEGIKNTKENRQKMGEIMFETFHIPKLFIAKKLVLPLYSQYSNSGLMIDFGNDIITIAPILEGYYLLPIETFLIPSYSFFEPNIIDKVSNRIQSYHFDIRRELTNVEEYANLLNACGKNKEYTAAISIELGKYNQMDFAESLLSKYSMKNSDQLPKSYTNLSLNSEIFI